MWRPRAFRRDHPAFARFAMPSDTTHPSLLVRMRDLGDADAWREFDARYGDLILRFSRKMGLQYSDAQDVRQVVMLSLARSMPGFQYTPQRGRFRSYLGQVVRNAVFHHLNRPNRREQALSIDMAAVVAEPLDTTASDPAWEREWENHHYRLAMRSIRASFDPRSVQVFNRLVAGATLNGVAREFDLSEAAVHKIKQRIRDRLRDLIARQTEDEGEPDHA